jgi:hypothetical protein
MMASPPSVLIEKQNVQYSRVSFQIFSNFRANSWNVLPAPVILADACKKMLLSLLFYNIHHFLCLELKHRTMTSVDDKIAIPFFKKLKSLLDCGYLDEETKTMIKKEPALLECQCPDDDDLDDWSGSTATECMCESLGPSSRDLLHELVESGAMATDECYSLCFGDGDTSADFLEVLLESGYMPLNMNGMYFLDRMVEGCDEPEYVLEGCMKMLQRKAKSGDQFGFGEISAKCVKKLENLPELQVGTTHKEGGPFEEFEESYRKEHEDEDSKDVDEEDSDDEEEVQKRKKRRHK